MKLVRMSDAEEVALRAVEAVAFTLASRNAARIVLPAGATPVPMYRELVRRAGRAQLDLSAAHLFQLDEFVGVSSSDPGSFHAFLRKHLLDQIARSPGRDYLLNGRPPHPVGADEEIARHASELYALGGADLVLLGLGANGHVAFNEPGCSAADGARVVDLHSATVSSCASSFEHGGVPRQGLTLGLREILASRALVLMVTGAPKASVLQRLLEGESDPLFPASFLLGHTSLTILADAQALPERFIAEGRAGAR